MTRRKIIITILILLLSFQFIRIEKNNPPTDLNKDIITVTNAPVTISKILKVSCYDCHSNESTYPWYTNVAPVSWWIKNHINDGRKHLNFSNWADYTTKKQNHKLEECVENVTEGEMPLSSYTIIHGDAKLTDQEKNELIDWFKSVRGNLKQ